MPDLRLAELLRPELAELRPYVPHAGEYRIRLDANEAPPLLGERARVRLAEEAAQTAWERYPDATTGALRGAIAARCGVQAEEISVGVGSDEVIALLLTALSRARDERRAAVVTTTPTFVMYRMSARVRGLGVVEVPLAADWSLSEPAMLRALEMTRPSVVFIASPNNPTGTVAAAASLEAVVEAATGALVVIDEAYVDYADADVLGLWRRHENVAVLRTLSKVGFAALRVGWLIARAELAHALEKVRQPYNVNGVSQRLARVVLEELWDEVRDLARQVVGERERVARALGGLGGVRVTPSQANFLWLRTERPAAEVWEALGARGILVRSFHERGGRLAHQLRVTVGTREENDALIAAVGEVV